MHTGGFYFFFGIVFLCHVAEHTLGVGWLAKLCMLDSCTLLYIHIHCTCRDVWCGAGASYGFIAYSICKVLWLLYCSSFDCRYHVHQHWAVWTLLQTLCWAKPWWIRLDSALRWLCVYLRSRCFWISLQRCGLAKQMDEVAVLTVLRVLFVRAVDADLVA